MTAPARGASAAFGGSSVGAAGVGRRRVAGFERWLRTAVDPWLGAGAVTLGGAGLIVALAGAAAGDLRLLAGGGAAVGGALVLLVAAGWIDGAVAVVLALPLPALYSTDEVRLAVAAPVTAAVVLGWALRRGVSDAPLALGRLPRRSALALLAAFTLATAGAWSPAASARELLNMAVLLGFLVGATDLFAREPQRVRATVTLLVAVAGAVGLLGALEMIGVLPGRFPHPGSSLHRAALGFGQPNGLGLFLAVSLPLAVHRAANASHRTGRTLAVLAVVGIVVGLFATLSRGSWLAVLGGTAPLLFTRDRGFVLRLWLGAAGAALVLDLASGGALHERVLETFRGDWVVVQRLALLAAGVLMFLERPLLGVGPGGYADALDRFGAQIPQLWDLRPTPHNAYVQMAAETGVVGLAAFLLFMAVGLFVLVRAVRRAEDDPTTPAAETSLRRALLWAFGTVCAAGLVVWPFAHGTGQAVFLIAALGFAAGASRHARSTTAGTR